MANTVLLWALVVLVPLTNLRMICVDHAVAARKAVVSPAPDCDEFCPREAAPRKDDASSSGCLLVEGDCSAVATFLTALPAPFSVGLAAPPVRLVPATHPVVIYSEPTPPPISPPPELALF